MHYCRSCKFFLGKEDQLTGECHLFPAVHYVEPGHWCGQYKMHERKKKEEKVEEDKPDTKEFIKRYAEAYRMRFNAQYIPDWIKDTQAAKTLIKDHGPEVAFQYCEAFLENTPKWNLDNKTLNLYFIPKLRNKLTLIKAKSDPGRIAVTGADKHGSKYDWPDYVDYIRKGGNKSYEDWVDQ